MRRLLRVAAVVGTFLAVAPTTALADAPDRTGWWYTEAVGGSALPATTAADDLHVANNPSGPLAFAALGYHVASFSSATLTLHLVAGSEVGTPVVEACPTTDDTWKAGGDQPSDTAPTYTCAGRSVKAVVGSDSDGTTLTFRLDATQEDSPGVVSLAVVPVAGTATPFSFDVAKPSTTSLAVEPEAMAAPPVTSEPGTGVLLPADGSGTANLPGGSLSSGTPPLSTGSVPVTAPLTAGAVSPPATAPVLPSVTSPGLINSAVKTLALADERAKRAAVVLLVALAACVGYLTGNDRTAPLRLIGGRALRLTGGVPVPSDDAPVRGIGRFARPRAAAPRKLL